MGCCGTKPAIMPKTRSKKNINPQEAAASSAPPPSPPPPPAPTPAPLQPLQGATKSSISKLNGATVIQTSKILKPIENKIETIKNTSSNHNSNNINKNLSSSVKSLSKKQLKTKQYHIARKMINELEPLGGLLPARTDNYNIAKKLTGLIYTAQLTHCIYHVWLDCLYNSGVQYSDIIEELRPVLRELGVVLNKKHVFIVGCPMDDGTIAPAGSCFILLKTLSMKVKPIVLANSLHMIEVDLAMLRNHVNKESTLVLTDAYLDIIGGLSKNVVQKWCNMVRNFETQPSPASENDANQPGQLMIQKMMELTEAKTAEPPNVKATPQQPTKKVKATLQPSKAKTQTEPPPSQAAAPREAASERPPPLVKISSKERGNEILSRYNANQYLYLILKCRGISDIELGLLGAIFPAYADSFSWADIFTFSQTPNSVSGLVVMQKDSNKPEPDVLLKNTQQAVRYGTESIVYTYTFTDRTTLKASLLNVGYIKEYRSAKRPIAELKSEIVDGSAAASSKRNRIAATFGNGGPSPGEMLFATSDRIISATLDHHPPELKPRQITEALMMPMSSNGIGGDPFDMQLMTDIDEIMKRDEIVTETLHRVKPFGNAVLRVDHLPAKLTVNAFNLMMGTYTLVADQIVGALVQPRKGAEYMNIRIVIGSDNQDVGRIMAMDKCKTPGNNLTLSIKRTDLKELETFLTTNYNKLKKLETNDKLPNMSSGIAYGCCNDTTQK